MRLGQHFLKNRAVLQKIAESASGAEQIVEIGAGHGELTDELRALGNIEITALEKDPQLANYLKEKYKDDARIKIIQGDALKLLPNIAGELAGKKYALLGNIPYYITGHLFRTIGELPHLPEKSVFTIQKEVALRASAGAPRMNRLAAAVQYWAEPKILFSIPANDFVPKPQVESAALFLASHEPRWPRETYYLAVRRLFQQPRKTIMNNLAAGLTHEDRAALESTLRKLGIDPMDRPQNLSIEDIGTLSLQIVKLQ